MALLKGRSRNPSWHRRVLPPRATDSVFFRPEIAVRDASPSTTAADGYFGFLQSHRISRTCLISVSHRLGEVLAGSCGKLPAFN